ncbi:MAG: CPBP family intramembrane metalloprotease [Rhizobiaceae bacterium]|nr:MAG: CPBP family intramembrane metalloprotease [Rhizobiaceae bacterium]
MIDATAFQRYRDTAGPKTTLPRLAVGVVIIVACWLVVTFGVLTGGFYLYAGLGGYARLMEDFIATGPGTLVVFLTFAGIWLGAWIAMRFIHRQKLSALFGPSGRLSASGFLKGFASIAITSLLSEVMLYAIAPQFVRTPISLGYWLALVVPVMLFAFVQTSAEELLFRGYLMRGLAYRFRSPLIWAVLPTLAFTLLHWHGGTPPLMTACVLITIGSFAVLLAFIVYATGNLGASMGAHFGNNIIGFLLISHEQSFSAFSLYDGASLQALNWTPGTTTAVTLVGIVSCALSALLLFHARSPLRLTPDRTAASATPGYGSPM